MASAVLLLDVPVVPPGRPPAPSLQHSPGPAVFSLRTAVLALLLFPADDPGRGHPRGGGQRLASRAAWQVSPLRFAEAVARGDFTEAELAADRFFQPAKRSL